MYKPFSFFSHSAAILIEPSQSYLWFPHGHFPPLQHRLGRLFSPTNGVQPRGMQSISNLTRGLQFRGLHSYLGIKVLNKLIVSLCTCYLVLVYCNPYKQSAQQLSEGREKSNTHDQKAPTGEVLYHQTVMSLRSLFSNS